MSSFPLKSLSFLCDNSGYDRYDNNKDNDNPDPFTCVIILCQTRLYKTTIIILSSHNTPIGKKREKLTRKDGKSGASAG